MKRKHNLKLPNGFGSIVYLGENRRKPWGALKTIGWNSEGKQIKKYIAYEETYVNVNLFCRFLVKIFVGFW